MNGVASAEDGDAAGVAGGKCGGEWIDHADEGQGRGGDEFAPGVLRRDGGEDGELGTGGLEAPEEGVEVFGEVDGGVGLDVLEDAGGLGVGDDDVEGSVAGVMRLGERLIVVNGGSNAKPTEETEAATFAHKVSLPGAKYFVEAE